MGRHLPLAELAAWTGLAFALWLLLIPVLGRLRAPAPAIVGALLSWLLARVLVAGVPEVMRWAAHVLHMTS